MSNPGERDDAPEIEEVLDVEEQGSDVADTDEGGDDEVGEEPDDGTESDGEADLAGKDDGQGGGQDQVTAKPLSRATRDVLAAKNAAKEARAEAERLRAEMAALQQERQGRQTAEQQRLEQERVALMAPEEKVDYLLRKQEEGFNARFGQLQFQQADSADRTAFEARCARVPAFDAIRDDVEAALAKARASGGNPSRETVAKYLIGERAVARAEKGGKGKQAAKGQQNISRQTVKAPAGRSDVKSGQQRSGGGEAAARRSRLENLEI